MLKYTFDNSKGSFFKSLKEKVDLYFSDNKLSAAGNGKLYIKASLQVLSAASLYVILVFFTPGALVSIALCLILGLNLGVIGFNVMHEGGHQTFSSLRWVNTISAYFLNVLGGNTYFWKLKHNINHHTYTNIEGMDSDIDVKPFMRLHQEQPLRFYHRFQYIYWVFLYGLSYLTWIFYDDFYKYFSGKPTITSERKKLPLKEHFIFWFTKLMYIAAYIVVPIVMVGWMSWIIGFMIVTFVCGLSISIVFQLAHVVEGTEFHSAEKVDGAKKKEWALHQLASTSNFATKSKSLFWLLGGLNFQIEHHLFPRISHIHYPQISAIVKEACRESGIVYHEYQTMFKAIVSHILYLKRLGRA